MIQQAVPPPGAGRCVQVDEEGPGRARPEPPTGAARDSRGIGLRLARARSLMLAHGGRLEVEAAAQIGTRVRLIFPATRLRDANGLPVATPAAAMAG